MAKTKSSKTERSGITFLPTGRYLVHNSGCELALVSGPLKTQKAFEKRIIDILRSDFFDNESDTLHILTISPSDLGFSEFSGGFMDKLRKRAGLSPAP